MKKLIFIALLVFSGFVSLNAQVMSPRKLADKMAAAFSNGLKPLDTQHLLRGRLGLSLQYSIRDGDMPEFESKTFRNFASMERWLKKEENEPGFPMRTSGQKVSCGKGVCRLELVDNQMAHNHVYLTRVWYGTSKGRLYVKRIRILYG